MADKTQATKSKASGPSIMDRLGDSAEWLLNQGPVIAHPPAPSQYHYPSNASWWDRNIKEPVINATEPIPLWPMSETRVTDKLGIMPKIKAAGNAMQNSGAFMPENFLKHFGRNMFGLVDAPVQGASHVIKALGGNEQEADKAIEGAKSLNPDIFYPKGGMHNLLKSYWNERDSPETLVPRALADLATMHQFTGEPVEIPAMSRENFPMLYLNEAASPIADESGFLDPLSFFKGKEPAGNPLKKFGEKIKLPSLSSIMKDESGHLGGFGTGWESPLKPEPQLEKPLSTAEGPQVPPMKPRVEPDYPLTPSPFFNPEKPFDIKDFLKNEEGSFKNPFEGLFGKKKPLSNLTETGPVDTNATDQHTGFGQGGGTPLSLSGDESLLGGAKESSPNEMQWLHSGKEGIIPINSLKGAFKPGDPDKAFKLYDTPPAPLQFPKLNAEGYGPSNPRPMPTDYADKPKALQNQIVATHPRQNFKPTIVEPDQFTSGFPRQTERPPTSIKDLLIKLFKDESGGGQEWGPEPIPNLKKTPVDFTNSTKVNPLPFEGRPKNLSPELGGTNTLGGAQRYTTVPLKPEGEPRVYPRIAQGEDADYNETFTPKPESSTKIKPTAFEQAILDQLTSGGGRIDKPSGLWNIFKDNAIKPEK